MRAFFYVSKDLSFQESKSTDRYAIIEATLLELEKPSTNGRFYRFEEADRIVKSMQGKPLYYGINWEGKHKNVTPSGIGRKRDQIGFIMKARQIGRKIKGLIKVTNSKIIDQLKQGFKFLFSIAGYAKADRLIYSGKRRIQKLIGTVVNSVQMFPKGSGKNWLGKPKAGFPSAQLEKILKIQESALYVDNLAYFVALGVL